MYHFSQDLQHVQQRINQFLAKQFAHIDSAPAPLAEAMKYGLLLGGKRIRPFLVYATGKMLGADMAHLDYAAAAIEAIHAYSLIHDDLPAMDDDELRRGHQTCHIAFDEATAILAGDALQTLAFEILTDIPHLSAEQKLMLIKTLSAAAGVKGMCLGQSLDLISEQKIISLQKLEQIHLNKTGALLTAALKMGFICSPHFADAALAQQLERYATAIGLAFQVQDDILDIEGDSATLGKTTGSDLTADKSTYPKLLGLEGAKQKALELYERALTELKNLPFNTTALYALAEFIVKRKS
ncbi:(2E,6E)-farnesyl diphosphate synthase [Aggregatibacter actinomycetemcomitans]|uniref:(2E,6E)-farnesyl diphosphate synthase n=1 Tax=Aggregatibacter actinomycetemcomitans TaxID=714 RepID=UPI00022AC860|nr:(2E,6E)-farnesyl diphosphate synthase [Aggregatibacter actinomycetemcomitans]AEW77575.1 geranyltranstransferase [Aggregatibacter actinomycetemcomitans ANH9381]AHN72267.1 geranyltranstransferase, putative [Aggregatibacter actinomycetemcomitans HK1651]AMQ91700.1 geranyl transferase [Aggregatibacter actinomycetemcomitans]KND84801.1 geranyl transferase [Aggregatibacter actinomycetemcomitans serotype b str. SCC1398]KOE53400.1 geranyl transferase [Aggregatibacter actinomycetemcomitans serotype b 